MPEIYVVKGCGHNDLADRYGKEILRQINAFKEQIAETAMTKSGRSLRRLSSMIITSYTSSSDFPPPPQPRSHTSFLYTSYWGKVESESNAG